MSSAALPRPGGSARRERLLELQQQKRRGSGGTGGVGAANGGDRDGSAPSSGALDTRAADQDQQQHQASVKQDDAETLKAVREEEK